MRERRWMTIFDDGADVVLERAWRTIAQKDLVPNRALTWLKWS